ncbi:MAG: hypothetical protein GXO21_00145 [Aquificae bacterium]|nr:hypothetical protein [Aquificota bacterium]
MKKFLSFLVFLIGFWTFSYGEGSYIKITNEMIYQKLIEIEKRQVIFEERFKQIDRRFEQIDKRFEQIDKRFEDINKRFEQINKRIDDLREDMNKRFEQMFTFLWIITGIFTTLTLGVIGFAFWDRRTIIKKAKEEAIEEIEKEGRLKDLIEALRELAKKDPELAKILKNYNLM